MTTGLFIVLAVISLFILPQGKDGGEVVGHARAGDGDSLEIAGRRLRLHGIDAPELDQTCRDEAGRPYPCGRVARDRLRNLVGGGEITCAVNGTDRFERLLVACRSGEVDINARMVADGWAISYGAYSDEEAEARRAGRGIWQGEFERPRDWRDARHNTAR